MGTMDDAISRMIFAVALAATVSAVCIGLQRAGERWKWFRIVGIATLILVYAALAILGVRYFLMI
jgi:hypothetical protein